MTETWDRALGWLIRLKTVLMSVPYSRGGSAGGVQRAIMSLCYACSAPGPRSHTGNDRLQFSGRLENPKAESKKCEKTKIGKDDWDWLAITWRVCVLCLTLLMQETNLQQCCANRGQWHQIYGASTESAVCRVFIIIVPPPPPLPPNVWGQGAGLVLEDISCDVWVSA